VGVCLELFNESEHIKYIQGWEEKKELYSFLSHTRPKYLRNNDEDAKVKTVFYLIWLSGKYVGATWLEEITDHDAKLSIYIADPSCRGQGVGDQAIQVLVGKAFNELNLNSVYLNVRCGNERAVKCYKKNGFEIAEEYSNIVFSNGEVGGAYRMILNRVKELI